MLAQNAFQFGETSGRGRGFLLSRDTRRKYAVNKVYDTEGKVMAGFELKVGVEPTTCGLRNRCSTTELLQHNINDYGI
jgi:hypothetical protein